MCPFPPPRAQDHKATDIVERARIEAAGGFVVRKRVMGVLAVARSFGDFVLKKFVSAEPYTSTTKLDVTVRRGGGAGGAAGAVARRSCPPPAALPPPPPSHTRARPQSQFIIIACDGIWDVLEDQEAVDMVREHIGGSPPAQAKVRSAAQVLIDAALAKGTSDNVTALVVFL